MKLRDWILQAGMRQADFAVLLDITRSHCSSIINGTRSPSRKVALKIAKVTDGEISVEDVLTGSALGYDGPPKRALSPKKQQPQDIVVPEKPLANNVFSLI